MIKRFSALALLVTACGGGNTQDVGVERTLDSGDAGSPASEPEPTPAVESAPEPEVDSGSEPEPGISVSVPVPVRPDDEPEVLVVVDAGDEPSPAPEADAGDEPEPETDSGSEPEPEPSPEPEVTVDAGEPEPEPLPETTLYWDGENGITAGWWCRGSDNYTMTPEDKIFIGGLMHCAFTPASGSSDGWARLDAMIQHNGYVTHKSLTFWACGRGHVRTAVLAQEDTHYSELFELTGVWQQYRISFDELEPAYDSRGVRGMTFILQESEESSPYTTDFRVDVLEFDSSDEPLGTSDVTCP